MTPARTAVSQPRLSTAREALIAEALGDVARLIDRLEALRPAMDQARLVLTQADKHNAPLILKNRSLK